LKRNKSIFGMDRDKKQKRQIRLLFLFFRL